ncbi:MAG: TetR/AcrR family transcriptional regulator, fatty acid metabolism regulator protein [Candidatus Binataceae bacterium]|nr:TetR/AcrR family transcriptional regulator, fatty acid metabolism regulator protein [Candidatus Binataceae bacterium]
MTDSSAERTLGKPRERLAYDERLTAILAAARNVLADKGYEKTVIADIAREAGIVEGTIYRYFKNKRDLLVKVAEIWFAEKLTEDSHLASIPGTRNKLRHLAVRTLSIIRSDPVLSRFLLIELRPDPSYRTSPFFELNRRFTHEIVEVCRHAIDRGEFRPDVSATLLRDMFFGCIEHRTWAFLRGEGDFSVEKVADGVADVIYRGMAASSREPSDLDAMAARVERIETLLSAAPWVDPPHIDPDDS